MTLWLALHLIAGIVGMAIGFWIGRGWEAPPPPRRRDPHRFGRAKAWPDEPWNYR